jgi:hypothetical protein
LYVFFGFVLFTTRFCFVIRSLASIFFASVHPPRFFPDLVVPLSNAYRLRDFLQGSSLFHQQFSGSAQGIHGNSSSVFVEDYS